MTANRPGRTEIYLPAFAPNSQVHVQIISFVAHVQNPRRSQASPKQIGVLATPDVTQATRQTLFFMIEPAKELRNGPTIATHLCLVVKLPMNDRLALRQAPRWTFVELCNAIF